MHEDPSAELMRGDGLGDRGVGCLEGLFSKAGHQVCQSHKQERANVVSKNKKTKPIQYEGESGDGDRGWWRCGR
jgi:hypothetical protein